MKPKLLLKVLDSYVHVYGKRPDREVENLHTVSTDSQNTWSFALLPSTHLHSVMLTTK
jgi:hypothetical protein